MSSLKDLIRSLVKAGSGDALFFWQKDHCKSAYESEIERAQLPPGMRDANE